ncbi:MAG: hypothetical protein IKE24_01600 [Clostridia bacterium]|nr:hypothetical protein [Clostridia bacterium]
MDNWFAAQAVKLETLNLNQNKPSGHMAAGLAAFHRGSVTYRQEESRRQNACRDPFQS